MPAYCLTPQLADKFKKDIIEGRINPDTLVAMTSVERRAFFAKSLGESNAEPVNALFESKLLLKNQQQGMITWAKKVMGISEPIRRDLISRIQAMDKVLNPQEQSSFLEDLTAQKMGVKITYDEAQKITELSKQVQENKAKIDPNSPAGSDSRMAYGRALVDLYEYVGKLKADANKLSLAEFKQNPGQATMKAISDVAGNAKAIKASMDNSAIFRQGWKTLWTHPGIWFTNAQQSFVNIVRTFGKDEVMRELNADIMSRPNAMNGNYTKAKLAVGVSEEAYPTTLPEKIPFLGRVYKASENAFVAFVQKTRADVFDKYIDIAKKTGVDLNQAELLSIGKLTNSLTGRGNLGRFEPIANTVNNVFFSPRMLKAHIDTLTQPITGAGGSNFVRKQAAINLLKIIGGMAAIMTTARVLKKDSVELDPRSSDFGKIKVGTTRFDISGGMSSLVTLASRLATMSSKSTTSGKVSKLNAKDKNGKPVFGGQTGIDVLINFGENKLSPVASVIKDLLTNQTFQGTKPTLQNEATNLLAPLPFTTGYELFTTPGSANKLLGLIADGLGLNVNSYAPPKSKAKLKFKY